MDGACCSTGLNERRRRAPYVYRLPPNRRTLLQAGTLALLLAGKQQIAFGASIMAVRVWPAEDYSRVTLESDVPLVAKQTLDPFTATPGR